MQTLRQTDRSENAANAKFRAAMHRVVDRMCDAKFRGGFYGRMGVEVTLQDSVVQSIAAIDVPYNRVIDSGILDLAELGIPPASIRH